MVHGIVCCLGPANTPLSSTEDGLRLVIGQGPDITTVFWRVRVFSSVNGGCSARVSLRTRWQARVSFGLPVNMYGMQTGPGHCSNTSRDCSVRTCSGRWSYIKEALITQATSALVVGLVKGLEQGPQPPVGSMGCCFLWVAWARLSSPREKKCSYYLIKEASG